MQLKEKFIYVKVSSINSIQEINFMFISNTHYERIISLEVESLLIELVKNSISSN